MTKTEIKKALYKQKPVASLNYIIKGVAYYQAVIKVSDEKSSTYHFEVPVSDMGDADFTNLMEAQYLNRWLIVQ